MKGTGPFQLQTVQVSFCPLCQRLPSHHHPRRHGEGAVERGILPDLGALASHSRDPKSEIRGGGKEKSKEEKLAHLLLSQPSSTMTNERNAKELLKWGLAQTPGAPGPSVDQISAEIQAGARPDLADPGLYNAIMGKSEATMMQEELAAALDQSRTLSDRCTALDNFEMLIEQIDNANNISSMKMWAPIISLLSSDEPRIQTATAWILGTAVQNNDKAQVAVLEFQPLAPLLDLLQSADFDVRSKAMYALSGLLKHNPAAVDQFERMNGWPVLKHALLDPNITLRRKTAFLINTLLFQDPTDSSTSTTTTTGTLSSATAVAPRPTNSDAPLERGPETMLTGVPHPDVARALVQSGILVTLLSSLLPPGSTHGVNDADIPPPSGPDGDSDPRADLDFAEKAATSVLTFVAKLGTNQPPTSLLPLFHALLAELSGPPLDPASSSTEDGEIHTRWQELSIDPTVFADFQHKVSSW